MDNETRKKRPLLLWALPALLLVGLLLWAGPGGSIGPDPTPDPYRNDRAQVDVSRLGEGVVSVRCKGETEKRLKVQLTKEGGIDYNYDLNSAGSFETYPLTEGEGDYTLKVLEHKEENRYTPVLTCKLTLTLQDPKAPFRSSNQFVSFTSDSSAAFLAAQVMGPGETDGEKAALALDYVVDHLTYDEEKATTVEGGYLPDLDSVLAEGKGICFDYAALLCAMLRSQNIPCKLQVGHSGELYHAWVEVWCEEGATAAGGVTISGEDWTRLDPTFLSTNARSDDILAYMAEDANYEPRFTY